MRPARVTEISDGGARLTGMTDLHIGTSGMLQIDGVRSAIPFALLGAEDGNARVSFRVDDASRQDVHAAIERIIRKSAA
jgi:hypothetical protein